MVFDFSWLYHFFFYLFFNRLTFPGFPINRFLPETHNLHCSVFANHHLIYYKGGFIKFTFTSKCKRKPMCPQTHKRQFWAYKHLMQIASLCGHLPITRVSVYKPAAATFINSVSACRSPPSRNPMFFTLLQLIPFCTHTKGYWYLYNFKGFIKFTKKSETQIRAVSLVHLTVKKYCKLFEVNSHLATPTITYNSRKH